MRKSRENVSCIANHGFNKPSWIPATHYCGGVTLILKVVVRLSFASLPVRRSSLTLHLLLAPPGSLNIPLFRVLTSSRSKDVMRQRKGSRQPSTPSTLLGFPLTRLHSDAERRWCFSWSAAIYTNADVRFCGKRLSRL